MENHELEGQEQKSINKQMGLITGRPGERGCETREMIRDKENKSRDISNSLYLVVQLSSHWHRWTSRVTDTKCSNGGAARLGWRVADSCSGAVGDSAWQRRRQWIHHHVALSRGLVLAAQEVEVRPPKMSQGQRCITQTVPWAMSLVAHPLDLLVVRPSMARWRIRMSETLAYAVCASLHCDGSAHDGARTPLGEQGRSVNHLGGMLTTSWCISKLSHATSTPSDS